ncbi:maternal effect protein oskar-like isoform X1 [Contarinia nasturtii]|uniref:maternal effect protein oskar-like isoform X1 n=1 Tax=Contarinia nasturtii TaxID=265458 RepID=UPI0012D497D0|nr:maternal effect protein oskar-like isoform X1 [Contarinia nasturtii]
MTTEAINIIKSILNVRCREGATIADIESDYIEIVGKPLPNVYKYLNSIDSVYCIDSSDGEPKWYVESENMEHIKKFIFEQKPNQKPLQPKPSRPQKALSCSIVKPNDCFFKDNIVYRHMRKYKPYQNQPQEDYNNNHIEKYNHVPVQTISNPPQPTLHAQFVGDDFFRLLSCCTTDYINNRKSGVQHVGLCVSGLSIQAAAKLIECTKHLKATRLIINVGSIDILHGHDLVQMCSDFENLIAVCEKRGLNPIITTLAPLANTAHTHEMVDKLRKFNVFVMEKYFMQYEIIDIWSKMTNARGVTNFAYFQSDSYYVSGSNRPHVLWNQTGRTMVRNYIKQSLSKFLKIHMNSLQIDA